MTAFLVIGGVGLAMLLTSLLLTDLFDLFDGLDAIDGLDGLDGGGDGVGWLSGPVIGGFLAAVGFGGALAQASGLPTGLSIVVGLAAGVAMGWAAARISRALMDMPTDPTPRTDDLFGHSGIVVTAIPAQGFGEVTVRHAGQLHKLHARADGPIPVGTTVVVTEVTSATAVTVVTEAAFFGSAA